MNTETAARFTLPTAELVNLYFREVSYANAEVNEALAAQKIIDMLTVNYPELFAACKASHRMMFSTLSYLTRRAACVFTVEADRNEYELVLLDCLYSLL